MCSKTCSDGSGGGGTNFDPFCVVSQTLKPGLTHFAWVLKLVSMILTYLLGPVVGSIDSTGSSKAVI